jgi:hypothetical protein
LRRGAPERAVNSLLLIRFPFPTLADHGSFELRLRCEALSEEEFDFVEQSGESARALFPSFGHMGSMP